MKMVQIANLFNVFGFVRNLLIVIFVIIFIFFVIVIIIVYKLLHRNVDNVKKRSEDFFKTPVGKSPNPYIKREENNEKKGTKCQYCGEEITDKATMCPFCGSYLNR